MSEEFEGGQYDPEATAVGRSVRAELAAATPARPLSPGLAAAAARRLAGLGKYVTEAVVAPQGRATASDIMPLVRRLAAAGVVSGFAILVPGSDAQAWGRPAGAGYGQSSQAFAAQAFRDRRREIRGQQNRQFLAAGAGLVGGLVIGGLLNNNSHAAGQGFGQGYGGGYGINNGYRPYQPQPAYGYGGYPAVQPRPAYGAYGNPGGWGGGRPTGPSDGFILAAKSLIAARAGSTVEADRVFDRHLRQAQACTLQLGPSAECVVRFREVTLDLGRGEFMAASDGIPVVVERQGRLNRLRPDILQDALSQAHYVAPGNPGFMGR